MLNNQIQSMTDLIEKCHELFEMCFEGNNSPAEDADECKQKKSLERIMCTQENMQMIAGIVNQTICLDRLLTDNFNIANRRLELKNSSKFSNSCSQCLEDLNVIREQLVTFCEQTENTKHWIISERESSLKRVYKPIVDEILNRKSSM